MNKRNEFNNIMNEIIERVSSDSEKGISRFLQANPYSGFEYYNFDVLKDEWKFFERELYYESELSLLNKEQICNTLENPHGKNTFFIVGYQGCGKSTFIHSVINRYNENNNSKVVIVDCDKYGNDENQIKKCICNILRSTVKNNILKFSNFIDFYRTNEDAIDDLGNDKFSKFYHLIDEYNTKKGSEIDNNRLEEIKRFINMHINLKDAFYLLFFWYLSADYDNVEKSKEKIMIFIDNLDCVYDYYELKDFISCIDSFTVDMSEHFNKFILSNKSKVTETFVSKIKVFIAMRETTKANLPTSHFSDAFRSIYTSKDMTEWYDKGEVIKKRIRSLLRNDYEGKINARQKNQLNLILKITEERYTRKVIYPLFNNNYRSAVEMIADIITSHTEQVQAYSRLIGLGDTKYRHGARGILLKYIFDEFNTSDGSEESCFKRIGVLDLLNRKSNDVSICRLILSYLSNYTETKCDSGRNSISLGEILEAFKDLFEEEKVIKILCEMFLLRDTIWTHLVSFNQMEYISRHHSIDSYTDIDSLVLDRTMLHYSCAGKIYIEYVATHFEFFSTRIFGKNIESLFSNSNLEINPDTGNYMCCDIINEVYSEVEHCCESLKKFNLKICTLKNYLNPYRRPHFYLNSHYVCSFKRKEFDGTERRFKQFHEERIILTHITYIDSYRLYVLNHCDGLSENQKIELNEKITECISSYVQLLISDMVLKNSQTYNNFVKHYITQIKKLQTDWSNFKIAISKNNSDDLDLNESL